jgi:hypothetical protein
MFAPITKVNEGESNTPCPRKWHTPRLKNYLKPCMRSIFWWYLFHETHIYNVLKFSNNFITVMKGLRAIATIKSLSFIHVLSFISSSVFTANEFSGKTSCKNFFCELFCHHLLFISHSTATYKILGETRA